MRMRNEYLFQFADCRTAAFIRFISRYLSRMNSLATGRERIICRHFFQMQISGCCATLTILIITINKDRNASLQIILLFPMLSRRSHSSLVTPSIVNCGKSTLQSLRIFSETFSHCVAQSCSGYDARSRQATSTKAEVFSSSQITRFDDYTPAFDLAI